MPLTKRPSRAQSTGYRGSLYRTFRVLRGSGGTGIRANDGHELDSRWEAVVDNLLDAEGLTHTVHPRYPGTQLRADFLVGDVYVEVWGMKSEKYLAQRDIKERLAKEMKLLLVGVEAEDFESAKALAIRLEQVRRLSKTKQTEVSGTVERKSPRSTHIDLWTAAEVLAGAEGALREFDIKLADLEAQTLGLQERLAELEVRRKDLEKKRADVISSFIS